MTLNKNKAGSGYEKILYTNFLIPIKTDDQILNTQHITAFGRFFLLKNVKEKQQKKKFQTFSSVKQNTAKEKVKIMQLNNQNIGFKAHVIAPPSTVRNVKNFASKEDTDIFKTSLSELKKVGGDDVTHYIRYYPNKIGKKPADKFVLKTTTENSKEAYKSELIGARDLVSTAEEFFVLI